MEECEFLYRIIIDEQKTDDGYRRNYDDGR
jgi:hypothetical protein